MCERERERERLEPKLTTFAITDHLSAVLAGVVAIVEISTAG